MKKYLFIFIILLITFITGAQDDISDVFAPFVSRLKATIAESGIVLTWKNSQDLKGEKLIYRYTAEINEKNINSATLVGQADEDDETYVDYPPEDTAYYYAVLIKDKNDKLYRLFIPYRNKTSAGIKIAKQPTEEELATTITNIKTQIYEDKVIVSFSTSKSGRDLILYRSTEKIINTDNLIKAKYSITFKSDTTTLQDIPIPGIPYYYAVLDAQLLKTGKIKIVKGQNTTENPIQVPATVARTGLPSYAPRSLPLPAPNISVGVESGKELSAIAEFNFPSQRKLDSSSLKAINQILAKVQTKAPTELSIQVLDLDKAQTTVGDDYNLQIIINQYLVKENYEEAAEQLEGMLSTHSTEEVDTRAHFYLGQAYYFQNKYKEAFLQFILVQDRYYKETQPWLDSCLNKLGESG